MIKLKNGNVYEELFADLQEETLVVAIKADGLKYDDVEMDFGDAEAISRIEVSFLKDGTPEVVKVWEDYRQVLSIEKRFDYPDNMTTVDVFFIALSQDNSKDLIKEVKSSVKESNDAIMMALCEVYEMIIGEV